MPYGAQKGLKWLLNRNHHAPNYKQKKSCSNERLSVNRLYYNKLLAQCASDINCDSATVLRILVFWGTPTTKVVTDISGIIILYVYKFWWTMQQQTERLKCIRPRKMDICPPMSGVNSYIKHLSNMPFHINQIIGEYLYICNNFTSFVYSYCK